MAESYPLPTSMNAAAAAIAGPWSARTRRILLLMLAMWLMNIVDLLLTISAHDQGLLAEANPIAHAVLPHGPLAIATFKLLLVGMGSYILLLHSQRLVVEFVCWALVFVYVGVSIQWLFCYEAYEILVSLSDCCPSTRAMINM